MKVVESMAERGACRKCSAKGRDSGLLWGSRGRRGKEGEKMDGERRRESGQGGDF